MSEHEHRWHMTMHLDGCHFYQSHYECKKCGASRSVSDERSVKDNPYSAVWMDPDGEETNVEGGCARCRELLAGAEPKHEDVTVEKGGDTVTRSAR